MRGLVLALAFFLLALQAGAAEVGNNLEAGVLHIGGYALRHEAEGTGPDVLVLGSSLYYARTFSQNLRAHLRMHFVDGRHFSPAPPEFQDPAGMDVETITDEIEALRSALDLPRVILVGHSNHAAMAAAYAERYPEHVSHLVLIGAAPAVDWATVGQPYWETQASVERKAAASAAQARWAEADGLPMSEAERFVRTYAAQGPARWYDYNFDQTPLWENIPLNVPLLEHFSPLLQGVLESTVPGLAMPLLVVLGAHDYYVPPAGWDTYAQLPNVSVHLFERSGHNPMLEQPGEFDALLLSWLQATQPQ